MEELINSIVARTGISRDQASQAAHMTADFLKQRLPKDAASQIDSILPSSSIGEAVGSVVGKIESTFRG